MDTSLRELARKYFQDLQAGISDPVTYDKYIIACLRAGIFPQICRCGNPVLHHIPVLYQCFSCNSGLCDTCVGLKCWKCEKYICKRESCVDKVKLCYSCVAEDCNICEGLHALCEECNKRNLLECASCRVQGRTPEFCSECVEHITCDGCGDIICETCNFSSCERCNDYSCENCFHECPLEGEPPYNNSSRR